MKGKLYKTEKGWVVRNPVATNFQYTYYNIHPYYEKYYFLDEDDEGSEVEFEIEDFWETGLEEVYKVAKLIKTGHPGYPELGETIQSDDKTWDEIFVEVEGSLHFEMPIRVKNWFKNKFKSPVKK
jgi:hypothetical protein